MSGRLGVEAGRQRSTDALYHQAAGGVLLAGVLDDLEAEERQAKCCCSNGFPYGNSDHEYTSHGSDSIGGTWPPVGLCTSSLAEVIGRSWRD